MDTLRIAMVGPFGLRPKGTMAARALPLANALAARGHRVKIVMPAWHTPDEPARIWQEQGVELEYVPLGPFRGHLSAPWIVRRMLHSALAWQPDVVHCFKPKAYAGLVAWALWQRRRLGRQTPALLVDEDDWEGRGGWEENEPYAPALRAFFRRQERWGLTHNDGVTVASRALETLVWSLGVAPAHVTLLPNGSLLRPASQRVAPMPGTVLLYTRLAAFDPARPAEVLRRVAAAIPEVRLRVVGQALYARADAPFAAALAAAGLDDRVEQLGWLPLHELPEALGACAVAMFPLDDTLIDRCRCSAKLADLVSLGLPVVADDVGEARSYIQDGQTGYLVPPGDEEAMAARIVDLLRSPALAAQMGVAARQRFTAHFDWHHLAARAEQAYGQAVAVRRAS